MMHRIAHAGFRLLMRLWLASLANSWTTVPRPTGTPSVHASGPNPIRVLFVGDGPAVGFGVLEHDLALPGNIARLLSASLGRGIDVDVAVDGAMTVGLALDAIRSATLSRYDAVILMIGTYDALRIAPVQPWGDTVEEIIDYLEQHGSSRLRSFVAPVHHLPRIRNLHSLPARIADRHASLLNAELLRRCSGHPSITVVPFLPALLPDTGRYRSPVTYRSWAKQLVAGPLSDLLSEASGPPARPSEGQGEHDWF